MLEQEMASIISFILGAAGDPTPYYWSVPESFMVPAIYFPVPEITTGGETFLTYFMDYAWYIPMFHHSEQGAYAMAQKVLTAIKAERNLVPLIDEEGNPAGRWVRLDDPEIKNLDNGAAQLSITWRSRRPYNREESKPSTGVRVSIHPKAPATDTAAAYAAAVEMVNNKPGG